MAIKLPITLEELAEILDSMNTGKIEVQQENTTRFSFLGSIIDVYHSTGTFKNVNTGKKGQGKEQLINYLNYLLEVKNTSQNAPKSNDSGDIIEKMTKRIASLENSLETLTERFTLLEETVRRII
jgi:hypothetical protein